MFNPIWYSRRMSKYIMYIDAVLPIYTFKDGLTTVSSMIFIMRMSIVNARTRKEGLYIHDIDVTEMEPVLTWNCNSSKMTSWLPSAFWITSPQRDCTWVMRNFEVFVVVGLKYQLENSQVAGGLRHHYTHVTSMRCHSADVITWCWVGEYMHHLFKRHMMECRQPQYAPITMNFLCLTWSKVVSFFFSEFRRC